jgi:hypothetical protein
MSPPSSGSMSGSCWFLAWIIVNLEDGGNILLRNVGWISAAYVPVYPERYLVVDLSSFDICIRSRCLCSHNVQWNCDHVRILYYSGVIKFCYVPDVVTFNRFSATVLSLSLSLSLYIYIYIYNVFVLVVLVVGFRGKRRIKRFNSASKEEHTWNVSLAAMVYLDDWLQEHRKKTPWP